MSEPKPGICEVCGATVRDNPGLTPRCAYAPREESHYAALNPQYLAGMVHELTHRVNRLAGRLAALEGAPLEGE